MERPEISTEDLLVRPWQREDAPQVHQACQDPEIHRWTPIGPTYGMTDAIGFVTHDSDAGWAARTAALFGVFDAGSGRLLGAMGLVRIDLASRVAELGYWTAPWARRRGVATRAGRAVATWGFEMLEIERLLWRAGVGNHASRLAALRIGFRMEGTARAAFPYDGGGRLDGWVAGMLPGEVLAATPATLGPASPLARQAAVFGGDPPVLALPGGLGTLRAPADDDADALTRAVRDAETVRWTTVPQRYERADAEAFITGLTRQRWRGGEAAMFAIAGPDGAYAGGIDLRLDPHDPAAGEIGFQVAPWARGKGYATAALQALAGWGFDVLGLERIVWRAAIGNGASRRVAEKAGFTFEGLQRRGIAQRGERRDAWVAAMLATDPRPTGPASHASGPGGGERAR